MPEMNPVIWIFGILMTLAGGAGFWAFLSLLVTRKSDKKESDTNAIAKLEELSAQWRKEAREETAQVRKEFREFKLAVIPLVDTLDDLLPKMVGCLNPDERLLLRDRVNLTRLKM